jgi:hypothetical protein
MTWTAPPTFVVGQVLTAAEQNILSQDLLFLANPPAASMVCSSAPSIINNTWSTVSGMVGEYVRGGITISSSVFHIPITGVYRFSGNTSWTNGGTGIYSATIEQNGTQNLNFVNSNVDDPGTYPFNIQIGGDLICNAGDTIGLSVLQASGSSVVMGYLVQIRLAISFIES